MKICLVCSSGGHFLEMISLNGLWQKYERVWITFRGKDTEFFLKGEPVYWAYQPTNRNIMNLIRNLFLALKLLLRERPNLIVSTGAGVSVPFIYVGRILGITCVYIESLARIDSLSLSGKLVYPVVSAMLVQWPELAEKYKKAQFRGQVI